MKRFMGCARSFFLKPALVLPLQGFDVGSKFGDLVPVAALHLVDEELVLELLVFVVELHDFVRCVLVIRTERHGPKRALRHCFDRFNVLAHSGI